MEICSYTPCQLQSLSPQHDHVVPFPPETQSDTHGRPSPSHQRLRITCGCSSEGLREATLVCGKLPEMPHGCQAISLAQRVPLASPPHRHHLITSFFPSALISLGLQKCPRALS